MPVILSRPYNCLLFSLLGLHNINMFFGPVKLSTCRSFILVFLYVWKLTYKIFSFTQWTCFKIAHTLLKKVKNQVKFKRWFLRCCRAELLLVGLGILNSLRLQFQLSAPCNCNTILASSEFLTTVLHNTQGTFCSGSSQKMLTLGGSATLLCSDSRRLRYTALLWLCTWYSKQG